MYINRIPAHLRIALQGSDERSIKEAVDTAILDGDIFLNIGDTHAMVRVMLKNNITDNHHAETHYPVRERERA